MSFAISLSLLAQAAFVPPPTVPALAPPGSESFQREQRAYEEELRKSCISENGIRLAVESWASNRARAASNPVKPATLEYEIAAAAYAHPIDMNRLERAILASAKASADDAIRNAEGGIRLLRSLSPDDRAIFARRFTLMRPSTPPTSCKR